MVRISYTIPPVPRIKAERVYLRLKLVNPVQMSQYVSKFLKRKTNSGKAIVTGKRVNREAGYGLEIPCNYVHGDNDFSIPWLREKIGSSGDFKWNRTFFSRFLSYAVTFEVFNTTRP